MRRTVKFLCGLASGQVIVLPSWLDACKRAKSFVGKACGNYKMLNNVLENTNHILYILPYRVWFFFNIDTTPFLVKDKEAEKQYKFDLHR